jgi:hypothetical protein
MKGPGHSETKELLNHSSLIKEVYRDNFEYEIKRISYYLDKYKYIAMVDLFNLFRILNFLDLFIHQTIRNQIQTTKM